MPLIKCTECNKEISSEALNCPNCGYPVFEKTKNNNKKQMIKNKGNKKKDSALSIWAVVLSLFPFLTFTGLILALVDLGQNDKEKSHGYSWVAIVFFILYMII